MHSYSEMSYWYVNFFLLISQLIHLSHSIVSVSCIIAFSPPLITAKSWNAWSLKGQEKWFLKRWFNCVYSLYVWRVLNCLYLMVSEFSRHSQSWLWKSIKTPCITCNSSCAVSRILPSVLVSLIMQMFCCCLKVTVVRFWWFLWAATKYFYCIVKKPLTHCYRYTLQIYILCQLFSAR